MAWKTPGVVIAAAVNHVLAHDRGKFEEHETHSLGMMSDGSVDNGLE